MADFNAAWWRRIHRVMLVPSKTAIIRVKGETWLFVRPGVRVGQHADGR